MSSPESTSRGWSALLAACLMYLVVLGYSSSQLPERVASHFGFAGQADSWMSRQAYLLLMVLWGLGIPCLLLSVAWMIRKLPAGMVNLPHRNYWLAPERRESTSADVLQRMLWLSSLTVTFCLGIHVLVVEANQHQPSQLSNFIWLGLGLYLLALGVWIVALTRHFNRVPGN